MKLMMVIACGAVAACASNKPPEDATNESASTTTTSPQANGGYQANAQNGLTSTTTPAYNSTPPTASNSGSTDQPSSETGAGNASAVPPPPPQDTSAMASPPPAAAPGEPDNSRVNKRDRGSASPPTPMDQGNGTSDLKITQQIRQAVVGDSSLSFTAKNVKIITSNGKVTLRGPVKSDQERQAIEASARKVAGENVDNQIEVKK